MKESTMVRVMVAYFKSKGLEPVLQRGAGPDLHLKEKGVVEVKGSDVRNTKNFNRMVRQVVDYAKKYPTVSLALPYDAVTLEQAEKLQALITMIEESYNMFRLYVVIPVSEDSNVYYVKEDKGGMFRTLMSVCYLVTRFDPKDPRATLDKAVENLINYSPNEALKLNILQTAEVDPKTTEVHI